MYCIIKCISVILRYFLSEDLSSVIFVAQICKIKYHKCIILMYEYMVSLLYNLLRNLYSKTSFGITLPALA